MINTKYLVSLIALFTCCLGCGGGGGGGGGAEGAAEVSIKAEPREFDVGDRTKVTIEMASVHPDGILLKVKFPNGLRYVKSSAFLEVDGDSVDVTPRDNVAVSPDNYLVFAFPYSTFRDEDYGRLTLELTGTAAVTNGNVAIDPDVNYALSFSGSDPKFQEEAEIEVTVID
jgi:hypothetical protein